jgi:aryl-alcohol dehydrogenase
VLGHEGAGFVAAVGSSVTGPQIGDHVTMTFSSCGTCRALLKAAEEAPLSVLLAEI